jgi:hypothetical protein
VGLHVVIPTGWKVDSGRDRGSQKNFPARLGEKAKTLAPGAHGLIVLDQAAWDTTDKLRLPDNLSLRQLPPQSPELSPAENVWEFPRQNGLSNLMFEGYDAIVTADW